MQIDKKMGRQKFHQTPGDIQALSQKRKQMERKNDSLTDRQIDRTDRTHRTHRTDRQNSQNRQTDRQTGKKRD